MDENEMAKMLDDLDKRVDVCFAMLRTNEKLLQLIKLKRKKTN
jgi:hypothetical protein